MQTAIAALVVTASAVVASGASLLAQIAGGSTAADYGPIVSGSALVTAVAGTGFVVRAMLSGRLVVKPISDLLDDSQRREAALAVLEQARADERDELRELVRDIRRLLEHRLRD